MVSVTREFPSVDFNGPIDIKALQRKIRAYEELFGAKPSIALHGSVTDIADRGGPCPCFLRGFENAKLVNYNGKRMLCVELGSEGTATIDLDEENQTDPHYTARLRVG